MVVWQENHWDLIDRNTARVTCTEQMRFTRDEVSETHLWSNGPGTVEKVIAKWRRGGTHAWVDAEHIHKFATRGGVKEIFCFNREHSKGETLDWCVEREIVGQFPDTNEAVEIEASTKSDHPRLLRITWPINDAPTSVEMHVGASLTQSPKLSKKKGRAYIEEKVSGLEIGESVRIDWTW